jgi:hypothetical protein
VLAYPEGEPKTQGNADGNESISGLWYGDKELIPGLWYYDDGYHYFPDYEKQIQSLKP